MKSNRGFVLAAFLGMALPGGGFCQESARPGQLRGVLSALKQDGDAWTRMGTDWLLNREYVAHLLYLATDSRGNIVGSGMYHPSQVKYGWEWLRQRCDRDGDGTVSLTEFGGPREWFEALDKDRDGVLTKDDFDWSAGSPFLPREGGWGVRFCPVVLNVALNR